MPIVQTISLRTRAVGIAAGLVTCLCISGVAQAQNNPELDAVLQQAKAYEAAADYSNAAAAYREYLTQPGDKSAERRHARLKLPVLQEAVNYGADQSLPMYLNAMDERANGNNAEADAILVDLIQTYSGGLLSDDALYLRAYIALMDFYEYQRAITLLQSLRNNYPQSRYVDTALFAEAIAHEQLGDSDSAISTMTELKARHTGLSVAGMNWARDEYLSRLWFERSKTRIDYLHHRAETATQLISLTPHGADGYQLIAEIVVNQQNMTLLLNESNAINGITIKGDTANNVSAFSGIVMGQPDSWVRITLDGESVRGMVSVFGERHELVPATSGGTLSDFHTLLLGDIDGNISAAQENALIPPKSEDNFENYLRSVRAASSSQLTPGTVSQVAMIGVVIDSKYNDYHSGAGVTEALSILNTTDGIFREQLGIALQVDTVVVIDNRANDPMNLGSVTMETMMRNFKDYRLESSDLGSEIGLATLFSGNKNSDSALGLAWIGSACRTDGFDVSVVTPYKSPGLLSTHEIGHTLGAPHDSDTSCSAQNGHIMWPFLSSSSGRTFSSCSQQSMADTMNNNNCHIDAMDLSLSLDSIDENSLTIIVTNQDTQRAIPDAVVSVSGAGVGTGSTINNCKPQGSDSLQCTVGALAPMQSLDLTFDFSTALSSNTQIVANVQGNGFIDVTTDNNGFQTDIYGSVSQYAGPLNSDPITQGAIPGNSHASNSSSAKSAGGGKFGSLIALLLLLAGRMAVRPTASRQVL